MENELTVVVVLPVAAVLLHVDVAALAEPARVAPALPLHVVARLALPVPVAVAGAPRQRAVLPVPPFEMSKNTFSSVTA